MESETQVSSFCLDNGAAVGGILMMCMNIPGVILANWAFVIRSHFLHIY